MHCAQIQVFTSTRKLLTAEIYGWHYNFPRSMLESPSSVRQVRASSGQLLCLFASFHTFQETMFRDALMPLLPHSGENREMDSLAGTPMEGIEPSEAPFQSSFNLFSRLPNELVSEIFLCVTAENQAGVPRQ